MIFMLMGIFYKGLSGKGYVYFIYLIILVPAVVMASITLTFDANFRTNVAFVLTGPVCLGIASLFCYDRKVSSKLLLDIMLYISLPIMALTTYIIVYTPSVKEVITHTASNSAVSGGFGPNQVATALGLGMVAMVVRLFLVSPNIILKFINLFIFGLMTYRAFVTFSRGGVIAAIIVSAAFLWTIFWRSSSQQRSQITVSFILFMIGASLAWVVSSNQTSGLLNKRYANEDALGREKEDVGTGRVDLFIDEMEGFLSSPFMGVGASRTKDKRIEEGETKVPSHNEVGRLLGEHGFLGIVALVILILTPLVYRTKNRRNFLFYAAFCFWFATINHSGMRIAAPAYIYALALLNVTAKDKKMLRLRKNEQIG
ncbi:O-antigen ligase family protein [Gelidibacter japonicus]|uniref:O-antigen ligase family protein n=1 Tax=Gelidibacter japonicus TaxID=1962232 RepID=UPI002020C631|nr:O-antigen ligase family protein [Gelidibacter japonicus]MCL8006556.1 O-antigen ligase family protein [Gelidibacter japonicus]